MSGDLRTDAIVHGLAADAPVMIDAGGDSRFFTTWGDFVANEADGIGAGMVDPQGIAATLLAGQVYRAGGGWSIRLLGMMRER